MIIQLNKSSQDHKETLQKFLELLGESKKSFRYYESRDISVVENHLCTIMLIVDEIPIGYGHLDREDNHTWLGIAIIEGYTGKGYAKRLMDYLILKAKENKVDSIRLAVDKVNIPAITLYEKYGFQKIDEMVECFIYTKILANEID